MPESVFIQLHVNKACWAIWSSGDQPHSDYNRQWQSALCMVAVLESSQPNPQRNKKWKMYALKQIKICAEYRDMLPMLQLDLAGFRPIGLSPESRQTTLGLGSMSQHSAHILICIIDTTIEVIVMSPTTWEAHHTPRAKPGDFGEFPMSLMTPQRQK